MAEAVLTLSEALDRANSGKPIAPTAPKHLKRWERPKDYFGAEWSRYYSADVGQSRDSDCLEQSNFAVMLEALGGETETVVVVVKAIGLSVGSSGSRPINQMSRPCELPTYNASGWPTIQSSMRTTSRAASSKHNARHGRMQDCKGEWSTAVVLEYPSSQLDAKACPKTTMAGWVNCYSAIERASQ